MSLPEFQYLRARSVAEAVEFLGRHDDVKLIAGGTDLIPSMQQRLFTPAYVLDLRGIRELNGIGSDQGQVEIGALTPLAVIEHSPFIREFYPVLAQAAATVASPVLRNMGTLGGNVCLDTRCLWYNQSATWRKSCGFCIKKDGDLCHVAPGGDKCWAAFSGDTAPALLCLDAQLEIAGPEGTRRAALKDFYINDGLTRMNLGPKELVKRVLLPEATSGWRGAYLKLRIRGSIDYPLAGVAVALKLAPGRNGSGPVEDARVAITAVNPAPRLVKGIEKALLGRPINDETAAAAGELAARTARPLTTSALTPEYRREMVRVYARRAVLAAARS